MWRRIGRSDFENIGELSRGLGDGRYWFVCEEYEVHKLPTATEGDQFPYCIKPKYPRGKGKWRGYQPLKDNPDLFLRFARLHGQDRSVNLALDWVRKYGLLGIDMPIYKLLHTQPGEKVGYGEEKDNVDEFFGEVERAAGVLAMYEAVLNGDVEAVESIAFEEFPLLAEVYWDEYWGSGMGKDCGGVLGFALSTAAFEAAKMVGKYSYPNFAIQAGVAEPSKVEAGWHFESLLGAMYLQMYWLIAAGGAVARCMYCGRVISLAPPAPNARKTRQDKKFCDDACRQRHHYHTKTKPRRQGSELK